MKIMIKNKAKILFLCIFFYGKINTKIVIERMGPYGNYNSPSKITFQNITTENGKQYINFYINLAEDLDQKQGIIFSLEYAANRKRFVTLRSIKEKYACRALNAYGGEPWVKMQINAGIQARKCPIKAGNYKVRHEEMDLDKMAFQAVPIGKVRINFTMIHNSNQMPFVSSFIEISRG